MSSRGQILGFVSRFTIIYVLLVAPWPGAVDMYRTVFITAERFVLESIYLPTNVRVEAVPGPRQKADTAISVRSDSSRSWTEFAISSRYVGHLPVATLVSLVLATPIGWRRRSRALLWGLILVNMFISLRVLLAVVHGFHQASLIGEASQPTIWSAAVAASVRFATVGQAVSYVVPILLWILVTVRREDLGVFLDKGKRAGRGQGPRPRAAASDHVDT